MALWRMTDVKPKSSLHHAMSSFVNPLKIASVQGGDPFFQVSATMPIAVLRMIARIFTAHCV
jgi:hypothetical protein